MCEDSGVHMPDEQIVHYRYIARQHIHEVAGYAQP
jgi:hypothetical protein